MSLMNGGITTTSSTSGGGGSGTSTPAGEDVGVSSDILGGMMGEKKWGAQGGAPMFNTPNCMSPIHSSFSHSCLFLLSLSICLKSRSCPANASPTTLVPQR